MVTAPLRWRSQLCPCGFCPDGTRIEWRYSLDIRFRPQKGRRGRRREVVRTQAWGPPRVEEGDGGGEGIEEPEAWK